VIEIVPTEATLGAEIRGLDVRHLDDATFAEVEAAFHEHAVLVFRQQHLTRDEHVAFACRFGELEVYSTKGSYSTLADMTGAPFVADITNVDEHGVLITDRQHPFFRQIAGNEFWHADSSFKPHGSKASVLAAVEVPPAGGDTEFADMRASYDALTREQQERLARLEAWHSIAYSQAVVGSGDVEPADDPTTMPGVRQPIVRRHPVTGRPSLFIGRHACHVFGMDLADGQRFLQELVDAACQPPRVFAHRWTVGDVVIWDNRCALHRATPWNLVERRVMRHVRLAGAPDHAQRRS
jgi:alpha-ketoglutarate-dependent taurine dioxygenase